MGLRAGVAMTDGLLGPIKGILPEGTNSGLADNLPSWAADAGAFEASAGRSAAMRACGAIAAEDSEPPAMTDLSCSVACGRSGCDGTVRLGT
mmetsp:Transcript_9604/g.34106  ORF Transcript_9604/g.34106 Transcript_9604/m.34106 type:complete len:92 (+) Transcript_9604:960-1235(+)